MTQWRPITLLVLCVFHPSVEINSATFKKLSHLPTIAEDFTVMSFTAPSTTFGGGLTCGGLCSRLEVCTTFCYKDHQCFGYKLNIARTKAAMFPGIEKNFTACYSKPPVELYPIMESFNLTGNGVLKEIEKMFDNDCSVNGSYHAEKTVWFQLAFPEPQLVSRVYFVHDSYSHFLNASYIKLHQEVTSPPGAGTSFSLTAGNQKQFAMSIYELNPPQTGMAVSFASETGSHFSGCELWIE